MVVIVCLVLVLVVALGWIFYQNFIYKAPTQQTTTQGSSVQNDTSDVPQQEQVTEDSKTVLALLDWGVEVPVSDSSYKFVAKGDGSVDAPKNTVYIQSLEVATKCVNDGTVGMVNLEAEGATAKTSVGGKTYYFHAPQAACSEDSKVNDYQAKATEAFAVDFKDLRVSK